MQWQQHWQLGPTQKFRGAYALFLWCMSTYTSETGWFLWYVSIHFWNCFGLFLWYMSSCTSGNVTLCFCGICQHKVLTIIWSVSVADIKHESGAIMVCCCGMSAYTSGDIKVCFCGICTHVLPETLWSASVPHVNTHF